MSAEAIGQLYRLRWQIEVAIKRMKSVLDVDLLRARYPGRLALVWLTGKLLYVVLIDQRLRRVIRDLGFRLDGERRWSWFRVWKLTKDEMTVRITGVLFWKKHTLEEGLDVLAERPRRRSLQILPEPILELLQSPLNPNLEKLLGKVA